MQSNTLQLHPDITNLVLNVGDEKTPVIIIDNFLANLDAFVDSVCAHVDFDAEKQTYYPGFRARIGEDYCRLVVNTLGRHLFKVFAVPEHHRLVLDGAYYSLVATPPEQLLPAQCRPHCDTAMPYYLAIMQYLSPGEHGGTGFFKHKQTGFERITPERKNQYSQSVARFDQLHGNPSQSYITASNDQFELMGSVEYRPNRMIIYPGNLLHSGLINPATDIDKNPRTGRLTANIFLNFMPR